MAAQSPAGPEMLVNSRLPYLQSPPRVSCDAGSTCALVWWYQDDDVSNWIEARVITPWGRLGVERQLRMNDGTSQVSLRGLEAGFFAGWERNLSREEYGVVFQRFGVDLLPSSDLLQWRDRPQTYYGLSEILPVADTYAVLWQGLELGQETPDCPGCDRQVFLSILDSGGRPIVSEVRVNDAPNQYYAEPGGLRGGLAVGRDGQLIVVFTRKANSLTRDADVFVRRFSARGEPLGPKRRVNTFRRRNQRGGQVAAAPSGDFVVVWMSDLQDGSYQGIYARLYGPDGSPRTAELRVNEITLSTQLWPRVAMDAQGNFAVVWQSFDPVEEPPVIRLEEIKARLFRADGTPVAGEILVNQVRHDEQIVPDVAFAPNGTFLVGWSSGNLGGVDTLTDVAARRFAASPGAEVCWLAGPALACDLGRTGGRPELRQGARWAGEELGAIPLLGDFDGDGRDDLCAWRRGELRCDLDHEGKPAEGRALLGRDGDTPLLGDVDGDTRADPCVSRGRTLLCDTARKGGRPKVRWVLGNGRGTPLLGDVDGDGRDDLCRVDEGRWTCFPWAGGRLRRRFGEPAAVPLLGDVDGDGRADFCALAGGHLACTAAAQPGGADLLLELDLRLPPDARALLGNLDGL